MNETAIASPRARIAAKEDEPMGEGKRRREANEVDSEGFLTRLAGIDLAHEDRRERACLTDTLRDFVTTAMHAGGAGFVGLARAGRREYRVALHHRRDGRLWRPRGLFDQRGPAWGGHIVFATPPPDDPIGPPSPVEIMRRALMQICGFTGEVAAGLWRPGSCADDMVVSTRQTQVLSAALDAPDRIPERRRAFRRRGREAQAGPRDIETQKRPVRRRGQELMSNIYDFKTKRPATAGPSADEQLDALRQRLAEACAHTRVASAVLVKALGMVLARAIVRATDDEAAGLQMADSVAQTLKADVQRLAERPSWLDDAEAKDGAAQREAPPWFDGGSDAS